MGAPAHPEHPYRYTLSAPALPTSPRLCRDFVRGVFTASGLDQLAEAAAICTSELVTNVHPGRPQRPPPTATRTRHHPPRRTGFALLRVLTDYQGLLKAERARPERRG
ncbi:hypothetical protein [Streptomyces rugosispiralis]|uniref:Uncharacterized protein n=1 Tax=Streptomyces rugosispiralis TaxID=2967341 RepID=A0ABT1V828_9ACTN|nr:hypothetical protein [Streptomyces rugosispiralis]MCQ8193548.1 hypothetical protein [Streptomyces rugosispiralis]